MSDILNTAPETEQFMTLYEEGAKMEPQMRLVTFEGEMGKVWGIELEIYIDEKLREEAQKILDLEIPENIQHIKFISLIPDSDIDIPHRFNMSENRSVLTNLKYRPFKARLAEKIRWLSEQTDDAAQLVKDNIANTLAQASDDSDVVNVFNSHYFKLLMKNPDTMSILDHLKRDFYLHSHTLESVINKLSMLSSSDEVKKSVEIALRTKNNDQIIMFLGHGGFDPLQIGEQTEVPLLTEKTMKDNKPIYGKTRPAELTNELDPDAEHVELFNLGNRILVQEIIDSVEQSGEAINTAIIAINNCNPKQAMLTAEKIPVVISMAVNTTKSYLDKKGETKFISPSF